MYVQRHAWRPAETEGKRQMRRRAGVSAFGVMMGCVLVGATGACGSSEATDAGGSGGVEAPPLADYAHIPLPTTAPPPGAIIHAVNFADPAASGQHIAFQYQGFTIQACWRRLSVAASDACLPQQGVSIFRTEKSLDAETLFTVSTKNDTALPGDAATALQIFKTADLAARPAWLPGYAADELAKLTGR
jgi:hypothetical protein